MKFNKYKNFNRYNYYTSSAINAGSSRELLTLGAGFAFEFPILVIIMVFLAFVFGVTIFTGLLALISNIYFLVLFGILILLLIFNSNEVLIRPTTFTLIFSALFTIIMVYEQYSSLINTNFVCNIPLIGSFLCGTYEALLTIPNILFYFIPSFIVFGIIVWLREIL